MANRDHDKRVARFDDTGSFSSLEEVARVDASSTSEPVIYGLDLSGVEGRSKSTGINKTWIMVGAAIAALALVAGLFITDPFGLFKRPKDTGTSAAGTESADASIDTAPQPEGDGASAIDGQPAPMTELSDQPFLEDLVSQARQLTFDGESLAIADDDVVVEVSRGSIQVTHTLSSLDGVDAVVLAGNAARRAAALANSVASKTVQGAGDEMPNEATDVVWIVRNPEGDSFLAVCFPAGDAPTSGIGLAVLSQSPRYRLSDSLNAALGGLVPQYAGETPMLIDGSYIWSTAELPA